MSESDPQTSVGSSTPIAGGRLDVVESLIDALVATRDFMTAPPPAATLHLVIVPDYGRPGCETFTTLEPLLARLRALRNGGEVHVFVFQGVRFFTSQNGDYLVTDTMRYPILAESRESEIAEDGRIGQTRSLPLSPSGDSLVGFSPGIPAEADGDEEDSDDLGDAWAAG